MPLSYSSYLKLDEILKQQIRKSDPHEHDEMLFIIIHQTYELWFKQILHELDFLKKLLNENKLSRAIKTTKRINTILKVIVHQVDILETMTPLEFLSFRNFLESSSGFQSHQFRELEFMLGSKNPRALKMFEESPEILEKLNQRINEHSLWDVFMNYLNRNYSEIPQEIINRDISQSTESNERVQKILIEIYKSNSEISDLCETFVDMDEGIQEWRYRHVKMVERTIGAKKGTGGSAGVEYLKRSLFKPVFPDLWEIRSEFE